MRKSAFRLGASALLFVATAFAGEQSLMHCFVFSPLENVTGSDWDGFYKETNELPRRIDGLQKVWVGPLQTPKWQTLLDQEGKPHNRRREYGVCMEFADEAALEGYADHPAHQAWEQAYFKVREPVTFTFDILGR